MNKDVINRKLESLRRCIARITSKMPITPEALRSNYDLQDIIAFNLERAVQICVDIAAHVISKTEVPPPSTMTEGFARLAELQVLPPQLADSLQKAVAFRNILVHNYTDINRRFSRLENDSHFPHPLASAIHRVRLRAADQITGSPPRAALFDEGVRAEG